MEKLRLRLKDSQFLLFVGNKPHPFSSGSKSIVLQHAVLRVEHNPTPLTHALRSLSQP